jgi:Na+/proline symporter
MGTRAIFLILPFLLSISVSYDAFMRYQSARSAAVARWGCILAGIIVIALWAMAGILIASQAGGILDTIIIFNYPYMGSMLVPLLGGVLFPRATAKGAVAAIFVGGTIGVVSFLAGVPGRMEGLFNVDLGLLLAYSVSAVVFVVVSLYTHPRRRAA